MIENHFWSTTGGPPAKYCQNSPKDASQVDQMNISSVAAGPFFKSLTGSKFIDPVFQNLGRLLLYGIMDNRRFWKMQ